MWPFSLLTRRGQLPIKWVDERFATAGQVRPEDLRALADQGFNTIVCVRPDREEANQPAFQEIATVAASLGLVARHIPIQSAPAQDDVADFAVIMRDSKGLVLGYCRSGARAGKLYEAVRSGL